MKSLLASFFLAGSLYATELVPLPKSAELGERNSFIFDLKSGFEAAPELGEAFSKALADLTGGLPAAGESTDLISLDPLDENSELAADETYSISLKPGKVRILSKGSEGLAQATATLLQLAEPSATKGGVTLPLGTISDGPDQAFRSFLIDMGRNPHSPKTLRHVIDMMWFYKANYLVLHLTDDQLFSWPSKAFPRLKDERAGWTWEDFEAIEAYSQARGVTIIPEMDVPGHSGILRNRYPEVFGKTTTDLATNPEAQKGVETLIGELLSVFKSTPYYHMGGDEAYGVPQDAQRDFINRINTFVKSQKRQLIVWEGPHLGKGDNRVATDVIHMIWRNTEVPAQAAIDAGYQVINASWDPLYIVDHYPKTMFTAVDVKRCYQFDLKRWAHINHGFGTFENPHFTKSEEGLIGYCMPWWEGREENLLPLCLHRLAATNAAAWNRKGENDFASFQKRQEKMLPRLERISGFKLPTLPIADPETQKDNLAYLAKVTPSDGASQPHFGPQRITNGISGKFDHFLGFPTEPEALEIVIELKKKAAISRIVIYERGVGQSWEKYDLLVSADGETYHSVGKTEKGLRAEKRRVTHSFGSQEVKFIKVVTKGCQDLTFPSFSRISEVMAFEK
ncbi:MAG: family 20 glycosylhydrolase [Akkermansiaceae bacterium]